MRLLLDTHAVLWLLAGDERLRPALPMLAQADSVYVSAASWWELAIKIGLGRLHHNLADIRAGAAASGLLELPVTGPHSEALLRLPAYHKDPFDRMLVAQAMSEPMFLLTHDAQVAKYTELAILF
ncbi:MAG: type II toxin-antitoxin system VapC family toxin [Pseudomonadota bacterium]